MINRRKCVAFSEMFLLVSFSFAVAFVLSGYVGVGSGATGLETLLGKTPAMGTTNVPGVGGWGRRLLGTGGTMPSVVPGGAYSASSGLAVGSQVSGLKAGETIFSGSKALTAGSDGILSAATPGNYHGIDNTIRVAVGKDGLISSGEIASNQAATSQGFLDGIMGGTAFGTGSTAAVAMGSILTGAIWGGIIYGAAKLVGPMLGLDDGVTNALALGAGVGTFAYVTANYLGTTSVAGGSAIFPGLAPWAPWIGIGIGVAVFIATYEEEKKEIVQFECLPWEAPFGGNSCDSCNDNEYMPCSEYRCKSLGQACELVNQGSEEEMCVWVHKDDTSAPHMQPSEEALNPSTLRYAPDSAISPPNRGFRVMDTEDSNGCLTPFSKFKFGVETDELSKCKIDFKRTENFEQMGYPLGNSQLYRDLHIQELPVPNPYDEGGEAVSEIHSDGRYVLYIRCVDANGNGGDSAEVAFSFCVAKGPDTMPPQIVGTSMDEGSPVRAGVDEIPRFEVFVNEPSECKWSKQDKDYGSMENEMSCATQSYQINADLNYVCKDTLTGIKDRVDNQFYFRCKDNPNKAEKDRNVMRESYSLLLVGTEELVIDEVGPSGETQGSTSLVEINLTAKTSHGAEEGVAICGYSDDAEDISSFVIMDESNNYEHNQPIYLPEGDYTYYFRCTDAGGNTAVANTTFSVAVDIGAPEIARVFRDGSNLKVVTQEEAQCTYSTDDCNYNFEEGEPLSWDGGNKMIHYMDWNVETTYYVKCADLQGNQPSPDACQIIVQGSEF